MSRKRLREPSIVFMLSTSVPLCAVVCDPPCDNGACVANDTCACSEGFRGERCSEESECMEIFNTEPYINIL